MMRIAMQIGWCVHYTTSKEAKSILLQKYRNINGSCSAILVNSSEIPRRGRQQFGAARKLSKSVRNMFLTLLDDFWRFFALRENCRNVSNYVLKLLFWFLAFFDVAPFRWPPFAVRWRLWATWQSLMTHKQPLWVDIISQSPWTPLGNARSLAWLISLCSLRTELPCSACKSETIPGHLNHSKGPIAPCVSFHCFHQKPCRMFFFLSFFFSLYPPFFLFFLSLSLSISIFPSLSLSLYFHISLSLSTLLFFLFFLLSLYLSLPLFSLHISLLLTFSLSHCWNPTSCRIPSFTRWPLFFFVMDIHSISVKEESASAEQVWSTAHLNPPSSMVWAVK